MLRSIALLLAFLPFSLSLMSQAWSGILAPARAISWTSAGLPATLPDGETTSNPWTPPNRTTYCTTSACNTLCGTRSGSTCSGGT